MEPAFDLAFSLNTVRELRALAGDAGFKGATPVTGQFLALTEDSKQAFVAHVVERLTTYVDHAGLAFPMENTF